MGILPPDLTNFNGLDNGMSYKLQVKDSTEQAIITVPKNMRKAKRLGRWRRTRLENQ